MIFDKVQWIPADSAKKEVEPILTAVLDGANPGNQKTSKGI